MGMMKTFWVLGKKPSSANEEGKDAWNPLKLKRKDKSTPKSSSLSPDDQFTLRTTARHDRSNSIPSTSSLPSIQFRRGSSPAPAPDEWPELDRAIYIASNPSSALIPTRSTPFSTASTVATLRTDMREQSIPEEPMQASLPEELKALVAEKGNDLSLDEYAKLAEENAQKARKLADWMAELASAAKEHEGHMRTTEGREETGYCVIL